MILLHLFKQGAELKRFGELPYGGIQAAQQRLLGSCILGVFYHKRVLKSSADRFTVYDNFISGKHNHMLAS